METKKALFIIQVENSIDLITNSSSELFVMNGETLDNVREMIESAHPNYLDEYYEVVALRDATPENINTYLSWIEDPFYHGGNYWKLSDEERKSKKEKSKIQFAKRFGMTPEECYSDYENRNDKEKYPYSFWYNIKEDALIKIAKQLDPDGKIFLLFSIDDNPNWDYQEKLSDFATRYHLG